MTTKLLIAAAAVVGVVFSTAAMATSYTANNKCAMYARDLGWDIDLMGPGGKTDAASQALTQGQDECSKGKFDDGIATITGAIKELGLPVNEY
ncbi:MAG TPA: hypothetical protein VHA10_08070 [Hypericibacter adhaerens]|jgi:hypothetical protein|uniref:Uncharacterized protein n=1 Tax=Hypericibacter adhaerens TaxID=2602016 RepID=A0A5J6MYT9_9PROT|nr:hypothetical protein [Hypericibacter adhaerens]QEX22908.1 hypothetical protein FRZ61_28420 [Hypericibacter adhaerens]HWA17046.1 hypothetical protein [Gemmatimonadales bacterium]HWA43152.1 hypothetical protein [Hypericibacter adhaerens]